MSDHWRLCSSCKTPIGFSTIYQVCSVSTCNRKRTGLTFCSVSCWEAHLPSMRHREAWAVEKRSPSREQWLAEKAAQEAEERQPQRSAAAGGGGGDAPRRRVVANAGGADAPRRRVVANPGAGQVDLEEDDLPRDVLIVASKMKKYVKARSGMNTSDRVLEALSDIVRRKCDAAIRRAAEDGRKTVLDRDFE